MNLRNVIQSKRSQAQVCTNDAIYEKYKNRQNFRCGDRNQDSGFWVRVVVDWKGQKGTFWGR